MTAFRNELVSALNLPRDSRTGQRPAASALLRLFALLDGWPNAIQHAFGRVPLPPNWNPTRLRLPSLAIAAPYERVLGAAILAQRGRAVTEESALPYVLERMPQADGLAQAALHELPAAFVRWACNDPAGMCSVAAMERRLRDVDPSRYRNALAYSSLPSLNDAQLLGPERALVDARCIKSVFRIWRQLTPNARDNMARLGLRIPDLWATYHPVTNPSLSAAALRFVTFAQYCRSAAARNSAGSSRVPMTLWNMSPDLAGLKPPPQVDAAFRSPDNDSGYLNPDEFITAIWLAKANAVAPNNAVTGWLDAHYTPLGVRWMAQGCPQPAIIAPALAYSKTATSATAFNDVTHQTPDYFVVLALGDRAAFSQTTWNVGQLLVVQRPDARSMLQPLAQVEPYSADAAASSRLRGFELLRRGAPQAQAAIVPDANAGARLRLSQQEAQRQQATQATAQRQAAAAAQAAQQRQAAAEDTARRLQLSRERAAAQKSPPPNLITPQPMHMPAPPQKIPFGTAHSSSTATAPWQPPTPPTPAFTPNPQPVPKPKPTPGTVTVRKLKPGKGNRDLSQEPGLIVPKPLPPEPIKPVWNPSQPFTGTGAGTSNPSPLATDPYATTPAYPGGSMQYTSSTTSV